MDRKSKYVEDKMFFLKRSEERQKGWTLSSKMTFKHDGLVNERVFNNKNISKELTLPLDTSKLYRIWTGGPLRLIHIWEKS